MLEINVCDLMYKQRRVVANDCVTPVYASWTLLKKLFFYTKV